MSDNYMYSSQLHPLSLTNVRSRDRSSPHSPGRARISHDSIDTSHGELHYGYGDDGHHDHTVEHASMDILNHSPQSFLAKSIQVPNNELGSNEEIQLAIKNLQMNEQEDLNPGHSHKYLKTGTTIVGLKTRSCVILAADTRATEGTVVADTRCEKVHQLTRNVWACGAGTSADLDALTRKVRYTFLLRGMVKDSIGNDGFSYGHGSKEMSEFRSEEENDIRQTLGDASISSICHMIREELTRGGGEIGANLVLGGVDPFTKQPILTAIHPHGSIDVVPYTALGSGGLAAMGVLESGYDADMTLDEGVALVKSAVLAGIKNDLGSGSQVSVFDHFVILCWCVRNLTSSVSLLSPG